MLDPKYLSTKNLTQRDACIRLFIAIRFMTTKYGQAHSSLMGDWFPSGAFLPGNTHGETHQETHPPRKEEDLHALSWKPFRMFADKTKLVIGQYEHVGQHKNKLMCLQKDTNIWKDKHQTVQRSYLWK